jgi:hypothetical protein
VCNGARISLETAFVGARCLSDIVCLSPISMAELPLRGLHRPQRPERTPNVRRRRLYDDYVGARGTNDDCARF